MTIQSNLRAPVVAVEIDNSRAAQGPALLSYRALLVGQKTGQGTAAANSLHRVTSADDVLVLAGEGSMLHRMALAWFDANQSTELWIGVLLDSTSAVFATGTITVSGSATAAGTIVLYIGGERVDVAVAASDSANTIASAIAAAIGKHATGTVTLSAADAADNLTIGGTLDGIAASVTFVGTTGAVVLGAATYSVDTGGNEAAASLAAQINAHTTANRLVRATANSAVVTLRAVANGIAGNAVTLATTDAVDLAITGANLTGGAAGDNDAAFLHASVSSAVVTVYAKNAGAVGNEIDVRHSYADGEELPAGVSLAIVEPASGATNPTLTTLISAMGDSWYNVIAHPYTDATSLSAIEGELADRFDSDRMIDGVAITAKHTTYGALATLGDSRNSPHSSIVATNDSPTPPMEYAANVAAVVAFEGAADPARPFQTLALSWVMAPAEADEYSFQERNLLLYDGISTTKVAAGSVVQIERLITTYQLSAGGSPDTSYLDVTTMLTLMYLRYSFRARILARFPRHKLADDGTRFAAGQAVVTPKILKGEAQSWFREMESLALVEDFDQFKADLVVSRDISDPSRVNITLPPNLTNGLIVSAVSVQFRL